MISGSYDKQSIFWKVDEESQLIFKSGDYSIDCIKAVNSRHFITGSQNGQLDLWTLNKRKPIYEAPDAHDSNWITSIGGLYNTDVLVSGAYNQKLNVYKINLDEHYLKKLFELPSDGVVNDIKLSSDAKIIATSEGDEHKLGRWITSKCKNRIKLYKIL